MPHALFTYESKLTVSGLEQGCFAPTAINTSSGTTIAISVGVVTVYSILGHSSQEQPQMSVEGPRSGLARNRELHKTLD